MVKSRKRVAAKCTAADAGDSSTIRNKRGRPRLNPDFLPKIDESVVNAPNLKKVKVKAASARIADVRAKDRQARQEKRAEDLTKTRERTRLAALYLQEQQALAKEKRFLAQQQRRVTEREAEVKELAQLQALVSAGESVSSLNLNPRLTEKLKKSLKVKRKWLTVEERRAIRELEGLKTQTEIAAQLGISQSTVSKSLKRETATSSTKPRRGRPRKFTPEIEQAAARFRFLFNTKSAAETCRFLQIAFGVDFCEKTVYSHLKALGMRIGDFKVYPLQRNSPKVIEERFRSSLEIPTKYGQNTLYHAIYMDEMGVERQRKSKAFSVKGWVPVVVEDPAARMDAHIQLLYAASPELGLIHYEIVTGGVSGETILAFVQAAVRAYLENHVRPLTCKETGSKIKKRAFIWDNVRTHQTKAVQEYFKGDAVSTFLALEPLPSYSPFLNPLEEAFALQKHRFFSLLNQSGKTVESKPAVIELLAKVAEGVTKEDLFGFFEHTLEFIRISSRKEHVLSQSHYEDSHLGDEFMHGAEMSKEIELLLDSYLPENYAEFTPEQQRLLENRFNVKRLTREMVQSYQKVDEGCSEDDPRHLHLDSSTVVV